MALAIDTIKVLVGSVIVLNLIPLLIWWERKGAAYIQDRRGPNRANILGIKLGGFIHSLADVLKLLFKEDIIPSKAHRFIYLMAPVIVLVVAISVAAVIPFAAPLSIGGYALTFQMADVNVGILYILAIASLGVYGVMLAGWSSGSGYSLFGGLRASAQMISYEVAMGLALVGVILYAGTIRLDEMVSLQGAEIWNWYFVRQPMAFILFLVALFAETNRNPFDLPEGESELVAGYHTEYSSMKFALFFMAEYVHIVVGSMILVSLFFGGWQIPFLATGDLHKYMPLILKISLPAAAFILITGGAKLFGRTRKFGWGDLRDYEPAVGGAVMVLTGIAIAAVAASGVLCILPDWFLSVSAALLQFSIFLAKTLFFCWFFIWVRWTLPRFRYDQLMTLGWKVMVPLALINILVTAVIIGL